jgi:translation initiation factor 5A
MAGTKQAGINEVSKGSYIMIEGTACRVSDIQTSKSGKHGHAKVRVEAIGLIDEKKRIVVMPGHENVEVPMVEKKNAQVLSVHGDVANVMDSETYETFDMKIPDELKGQVTDGCNVLYWEILDQKVMKQIKSE